MNQQQQFQDKLTSAIDAYNQNDFATALQLCDDIQKTSPDQPEIAYIRALILFKQGEFERVPSILRTLLARAPTDKGEFVIRCYSLLGAALQQTGKLDEASSAFGHAFRADPQQLERGLDWVQCLIELESYEQAQDILENLEKLKGAVQNPRFACAKAEIAWRSWEVESCNTWLEQALHKSPGNLDLVSQYLLTQNYRVLEHEHHAAAAHTALGQALESLFTKHPSDTTRSARSPYQPWRIAFLSPDLRNHPVARFLLPLLKGLKGQSGIESYCYSTSLQEDEVTRQIKNQCTRFRTLSGTFAAELILQDKVDVLIDLAGHTGGNSLPWLLPSPRLAPVYATWLGYPNTTGFSLFDHRIVDSITDPPDDPPEPASEDRLRMEDCFLCYAPPDRLPEVGDLPMLHCDRVTLGCLNNLNKVNVKVLSLWAAILAADERFDLLLKSKLFQRESVRKNVMRPFLEKNIDPDRIRMLLHLPDPIEHLRTYQQIDLALDTFPYSGTTTTFEALLMGCPVITLSGNSHRSRVSASILHHLGLQDWIAHNGDDYLSKALQSAKEPQKLRATCLSMRERLLKSTLCDPHDYARRFLKVLGHVKKA